MQKDARLQALSAFLKAHRSRLQPQDIGLPAGGRRRIAGLRREEVAQAAGVSTTWYTWLEQGRDIRVSQQVIDSIARALRLNEDERKYFTLLAQEQPDGAGAGAAPDDADVSPALRLILDSMQGYPVIVSDRYCNIVAWNRAASAVFLDFDSVPRHDRNMIRLLFTRKELKALARNWTVFASGFLAIFRSYYGRYVGDGWYDAFIAELGSVNPEFLEIWNRGDVSTAPEVSLEFRHARVGKLLFDLTSLQVQGPVDLRCSVYTPSPASRTEGKIRLLLDKT